MSGHLSHYLDKMFPPMTVVDDDDIESRDREPNVMDQFFLKPMNCPHHHRIFAARPRSYRDLPLRLAEYGLRCCLFPTRFSTTLARSLRI